MADADSRKEEKQALKAAQAKKKSADLVTFSKVHGEEIGKVFFAGKTIRFYRNGYVEVLGPFTASKSQPAEKLLGIDAFSNIQTKTGVGRGVAAVLTVGFSFAVSSNLRGTLQLVITTDKKSHVLSITATPSKSDLEAMSKAEAIGKALLAQTLTQKVSVSIPSGPVGASLSVELEKLSKLKEQGLLSDGEFQAAKRKLLS
jgi:hypothetical protein